MSDLPAAHLIAYRFIKMPNYVHENRSSLEERHYVRKAGSKRYWFDFHAKKLDGYRERFGDDFCMVVFGSELQDDAYVMPYRAVRGIFDPTRVDDRQRWIGNIVNDFVRISGNSLLVAEYYNALHLLGMSADVTASEVLPRESRRITTADVRARVRAFNARFREVTPTYLPAISWEIARPGLIATYVKQLQDYRCQICKIEGFRQKSGVRYAEAYHIIELHHLIPGSYCSDNLVVVCPTCRKRLRYADVTYELVDDQHVRGTINGEVFEFQRNIVAESPEVAS